MTNYLDLADGTRTELPTPMPPETRQDGTYEDELAVVMTVEEWDRRYFTSRDFCFVEVASLGRTVLALDEVITYVAALVNLARAAGKTELTVAVDHCYDDMFFFSRRPHDDED